MVNRQKLGPARERVKQLYLSTDYLIATGRITFDLSSLRRNPFIFSFTDDAG
jgi:hypothetical protein